MILPSTTIDPGVTMSYRSAVVVVNLNFSLTLFSIADL
jgi:hypothetical protein